MHTGFKCKQTELWDINSINMVSAACSGYSFNNLLYKEWVTNDDKDCSIIPIKLRRYWKKKTVIEINIILLLLLI